MHYTLSDHSCGYIFQGRLNSIEPCWDSKEEGINFLVTLLFILCYSHFHQYCTFIGCLQMILNLFCGLLFFFGFFSGISEESSFDKVHQKGAHIADTLNHSLEERMIEFVSLSVGHSLILPLLRETVGGCSDEVDDEPNHQQPLFLPCIHNY